jgi:hypothetical protein
VPIIKAVHNKRKSNSLRTCHSLAKIYSYLHDNNYEYVRIVYWSEIHQLHSTTLQRGLICNGFRLNGENMWFWVTFFTGFVLRFYPFGMKNISFNKSPIFSNMKKSQSNSDTIASITFLYTQLLHIKYFHCMHNVV